MDSKQKDNQNYLKATDKAAEQLADLLILHLTKKRADSKSDLIINKTKNDGRKI